MSKSKRPDSAHAKMRGKVIDVKTQKKKLNSFTKKTKKEIRNYIQFELIVSYNISEHANTIIVLTA